MTDKQIIETLRNIKEHCKKQGIGCGYCMFLKEGYCQTQELSCLLCEAPAEWDMEKIERIINE